MGTPHGGWGDSLPLPMDKSSPFSAWCITPARALASRTWREAFLQDTQAHDRQELHEVLAAHGIKQDYSMLDLSRTEPVLQGWGSDRPIFERLLTEFRPKILAEVGTWRGASVLHMHAVAQRLELDTVFICIDTWCGSAEQWTEPEPRPHMRLEGGFPTLYREFIANVIAHNAVRDIYPLPISSSAGARTLARLGVTADLIYLDAAHDEEEVSLDLKLYWPLIQNDGAMFGHDYDWPEVKAAVDVYFGRTNIDLEESYWIARRSQVRPR